MTSKREQFMKEGEGFLAKAFNHWEHTAQCLLDEILVDFPFEKAWEDTSGTALKTITITEDLALGHLYAVLETAVAIAVRYGLGVDYRVKELKKKRRVDFRISGLILQKDCKCCAK